MTRPKGRVLRSIVIASLAGVLLGGCGGSGYTYVSNQEDNAFFKVPDDWTVYDQSAFPQLASVQERVWMRGFDASSDPSPERVLESNSDEPRGFAQIVDLMRSERDQISPLTLRSVGFRDPDTGEPVDPITYVEENPEGKIRILDYEELVLANGITGNRIKALVLMDEPYVVDRFALVDAGTYRRFVFSIGCSSDCWTENEDQIAEIADSWTLEDDT